ncbi:MAG: hypothetical protein ACXWV9_05360 [Flavisolibacter sp.]
MQRLLCLLAIFVLATIEINAQDDDKNVVIKHAKEEYAFVKGNATNPVTVKQDLSIAYLCNDYRTTIQVAEFYNDQVSLEKVKAIFQWVQDNVRYKD